MTNDEKQQLKTAIITMADPKGNWAFGWKMLCELAALDPAQFPAPFKPSPTPSPAPERVPDP
jgi:hypothetical protein